MKIRSLHLKNFKRFSDLDISDIPDSSKLVLLVGSNGSGKSSIFDALKLLSNVHVASKNAYYGGGIQTSFDYYQKVLGEPISIWAKTDLGELQFNPTTQLLFHENPLGANIYGRSSLRVIPQLKQNPNGNFDIDLNGDGPARLTALDERFHTDAAIFTNSINKALREPVFANESVDTKAIFQTFIEPINSALVRVFSGTQDLVPQLRQFEDATPTEPPKLIFQKGNSQFNFDLLSHGEKQVVISILNFSVRKEFLRGKVIFIDELDAHMHTALQKTLIEEIVSHWIAVNSQLWVASHSLGFIEFATASNVASIIDLDELNFDLPQRLTPEEKSNPDLFNVAISSDTLRVLINNRIVVFVENQDIYYLAPIINDSNRIAIAARDKYNAINQQKLIAKSICLVDKDFVTQTERTSLLEHHIGLRMLDMYSIENYLFHPKNIEELMQGKGLQFDIHEYQKAWLVEGPKVVEDLANRKGLGGARASYAFYSETDQQTQKKKKQFNDAGTDEIIDALKSGDFEQLFEYIPAKNYGSKAKTLVSKFSKAELASTDWFKKKILSLLD